MSLADKLRPHVQAIQQDAAAGSIKAQRIINLYRMHQTCPNDPGAPALCKASFDDWMADRAKVQP